MSAIALTTSVPAPKYSFCSCIISALRNLILRIKNFISRYILEPIEEWRYRNVMRSNVARWEETNKARLWEMKNSFLAGVRLDEEFKNSTYFGKLKTLLPKTADESAYLKKLNEIFAGGTCYGQGFSLLKCHALFHAKKKQEEAFPADFKLDRNAAAYFHALQFLKLRIDNALLVKDAAASSGLAISDLKDSSKNADRAKVFDLLSKVCPTQFRHVTRIETNLVDAESLDLSIGELGKRKSEIETALSSEIPHMKWEKISGLPTAANRKAAAIFEKFKGTAQITAGDGLRGIGHTVTIKKSDEGCLVFDPYKHTWSFYESAEVGIEKTLDFLRCFNEKPYHPVSYDISLIAAT